MNETATTTRAGTMGDDHELVAVNFNSSPKHYYYWVPREWMVHVGDELLVCTPSTPRAVVRIVELGRPLAKQGWSHKKAMSIYRRHTDMLKPRSAADMDYSKLEPRVIGVDFEAFGDENLFLEIKTPHPRDRAMEQLRAYQQRLCESMAIPPGLLTSEKLHELTKQMFEHQGTATGRATISNHSLHENIPRTPEMINMETITYLNGKPIKQATDAEMFEAIRQTEAEIKGLMGIENKPKALKERMLKLQADIDALVAYMDAR
jgi:hypothetical protein